MKRRAFLAAGAAAACVAAPNSKLKIGVTDWNLQLSGKMEALALAKEVGFAGIELSLGRKPVDGKIPLANEAYQDQYLAESRRLSVPVVATCLDILHVNGLKNDPLGQKWLGQAIAANQRMGVRNMLLPFFGDRALMNTAEMDYVGDLLREFGATAQRAGVVLCLEDTISAKDNVRILERSRSEAVRVFYDVGNSFPRGFDIYQEIEWLGKDRISHFHLKDNPHYLGEGKIDFRRVLDIIAKIGYEGYADLETSSPSKDVRADMKRNRAYIHSLLAA